MENNENNFNRKTYSSDVNARTCGIVRWKCDVNSVFKKKCNALLFQTRKRYEMRYMFIVSRSFCVVRIPAIVMICIRARPVNAYAITIKCNEAQRVGIMQSP